MIGRPVQENERKTTYGLSLNPFLVDWLRTEGHVDNLSGWVNEKMREEYIFSQTKPDVWQCECGTEAISSTWGKWTLKCPQCKKQYDNLAQLKKVQLPKDEKVEA